MSPYDERFFDIESDVPGNLTLSEWSALHHRVKRHRVREILSGLFNAIYYR